jgi:SAM-dependent methyltransferase
MPPDSVMTPSADSVTKRFPDHFSGHARAYERHRPRYPEALFDWLADLAPTRARAFDAGTGNGQAALALALRFAEVVAVDASPQMIASATPRVRYAVALAHESGLESGSVDLATAGQALHWFELEPYCAELRRVLRPGGVVAFWSYARLQIEPGLDACIQRFYHGPVGPFWPPERVLVEEGYRSLALPFEELVPPAFEMRARWDLPALLAYLRTWSAVVRHQRERGLDPVLELERELAPIWGDPAREREIRFPLALRVGRSPGNAGPRSPGPVEGQRGG